VFGEIGRLPSLVIETASTDGSPASAVTALRT
jgi:hypothetical protein